MKSSIGVIIFKAMLLPALLAAPAFADSITLPFTRITTNSSTNIASQLTVVITKRSEEALQFNFSNKGINQSSIAQIFIQDNGGMLGNYTIENGGGVDFSKGANPPDLPGGNALTPKFDATIAASAVKDVPEKGINPGENLDLIFDLKVDSDLGDVADAVSDGSLRIGMHVIGLPDGQSDSFVTDNSIVPEPASLLLLGTGIMGMGLVALRKKR